MGKSISYWEIMDKLRDLIKPEEFTTLKVTRTTVEFVIFEGEVETKSKVERVILKLDNKMIRLKDFNDLMRIRAGIWKSDFPTEQMWEDFFQNAKDMNEMKPGERPDTIHLANLPTKWFTSQTSSKNAVPSERLLCKIFEKFGSIRVVDVPLCDPFRKKMNDQISGIKNCSLENTEVFEVYVQFKDYVGFKMAMKALYNMKLVHKDLDIAEEVNIKIDFDKSKHLSDAFIRRREIVKERLILKARKKEEKERSEVEEKTQKEVLEKQKQLDAKEQKHLRRKLREEKRKAALLQKLQIGSTDEINSKIAKEEKKLLKVQQKLEAIRLVEELYKRIKEKNTEYSKDKHADSDDELKKFRCTSELEVQTQTEKLKHAMKGREMLKTILSKNKTSKHGSSSSDTELSLDEPTEKEEPQLSVLEKYPELMYEPHFPRYPYHVPPGFLGTAYPDYASAFRGFGQRRRPYGRFPGGAGPSRGTNHDRRRGNYNRHWNYNHRNFNDNAIPLQDLQEACRKYFSKLLDHNKYSDEYRSRARRRSISRSYSKSRSRSRSRRSNSYNYRSRRSHSRSRERSRSRYSSRSNSRERSRSKEQSRSKGRSRSKEKSRSKDQSRSNDRSKSKDRSRSKNRSRSNDRSRSKDRSESKDQMRSKDRLGSRDRSRSKGRSRSRDRTRSRGRSRSRDQTRSRDRLGSGDRSRSKECHSNSKRRKERSVRRIPSPKEYQDHSESRRSKSTSSRGEKDKSWSKSPG